MAGRIHGPFEVTLSMGSGATGDEAEPTADSMEMRYGWITPTNSRRIRSAPHLQVWRFSLADITGGAKLS
jgi:hypothetical protein